MRTYVCLQCGVMGTTALFLQPPEGKCCFWDRLRTLEGRVCVCVYVCGADCFVWDFSAQTQLYILGSD